MDYKDEERIDNFTWSYMINAGFREIGEDEIVIKKSEYEALKKDYAEWKDEYDHNCLLRLEVFELEKQLEQAKQETREILREIKQKYGKSCSEYYPEWIEFSSVQLSKLAKEHGIELE